MHDGLRENTRAIFDNEDVVLLTDDARLANWLTESQAVRQGVPVRRWGAFAADGKYPA